MITLLIARHGNTFDPGQPPRRVGGRTDLPLVEKGVLQARALGEYLQANHLIPDTVYASPLLRTKQTAEIAILSSGRSLPVHELEIFREIDYGPDENKLEGEVIKRVGQDAIDAWDKEATVPKGWNVDPQAIIKNWKDFSLELRENQDTKIVLVVTSNGIARFAPYITKDYCAFIKNHHIKISTGALCVFEFTSPDWEIKHWNIKPPLNN